MNLKNSNKKINIKLDTKMKWNKMPRDEIENKNFKNN